MLAYVDVLGAACSCAALSSNVSCVCFPRSAPCIGGVLAVGSSVDNFGSFFGLELYSFTTMGGAARQHVLGFLVVAALLQSCAALRPLSSFWQATLPDENAAPVAIESQDDEPESNTTEIR